MPSGWENAPEYGGQGGRIRWVRVVVIVVILAALAGWYVLENVSVTIITG